VAGVALVALGRVAAALCVAGVALAHIHLRLAWQAGTWRHLLAFGVAGVVCAWGPLVACEAHFAWQAWRLATWTFHLRGRCGTWRHGRSICVAGVALGHIDLRFPWQAWYLATSTFTLRGRPGTW